MEDVYRINRPCGGQTYKQFLTADIYPYQNSTYLGRTIAIRFKDENDASGMIHERNYIYDNKKPVFKVLRWDAADEGKVILVNKFNQVVVADVAEIKTHRWYKKYSYDDITFMLPDDIREQMTEEEYNETIYSKEKIYSYGQQSNIVKSYNLILIEFENDRYGSISVQHLDRMTVDYKKIAENVIKAHPEKRTWPLEVLRSFENYYDEHRHSFLDVPMRYRRSGILVRDDKNQTVVMTFDEQTGERRFYTRDEVNLYVVWRYDDEVYEGNGELDLWLS